MMKTIAVSKSSFNGGFPESKMNITEQQPICYSISSKPLNLETTFSSSCLSNSLNIPACQIDLQNCTTDDNEISIFDAQKYFNEGNKQLKNSTIKSTTLGKAEQYNLAEFPRYSSTMSSSSVDTYNARNYRRSFYATPTASSEASWNSQTGLLSNPPGTIKVSLRNLTPITHEKRKPNSPRWFFRRNCPCIGKKSTHVDHKTVTSEVQSPIHFRSIKPTNLSKQHDNNKNNPPKEKSPAYKNTARLPTDKDCDQQPIRISLTAARNLNDATTGFSFPILNPSTKILDEPPRDCRKVFHPNNHKNPIPKTTTEMLVEDDAASDDSSDLFELESFATQTTTYQMYNKNTNYRPESLDEATNFRNPRKLSIITATNNNGAYRRNSLEEPATPSVAPTEGYEPSEASIDWSVATAEGFDRASVTTYDDVNDRNDGSESGERGGRRNTGSRLLGLSCRSDKAVLVGPEPRRVGSGLVNSVPVTGNWSYNKPPLAGRLNQLQR